jgi:hypothetical protein
MLERLARGMLVALAGVTVGGCNDHDGGGPNADTLGVGVECAIDSDCPELEVGDELIQLSCLTQFKGGYCAIQGCSSQLDCPWQATCVAHDDGNEYCMRQCAAKSECNANRSPDNEANCSANFTYADPADERSALKVCLPPTG